MWARDVNDYSFDYETTAEKASKFKLGGKSDWRLPTVEELSNILSYIKKRPPLTPKGKIKKGYVDDSIFKINKSSFLWTSDDGKLEKKGYGEPNDFPTKKVVKAGENTTFDARLSKYQRYESIFVRDL